MSLEAITSVAIAEQEAKNAVASAQAQAKQSNANSHHGGSCCKIVYAGRIVTTGILVALRVSVDKLSVAKRDSCHNIPPALPGLLHFLQQRICYRNKFQQG
jgi:hypothetical protein